MRLRGTSVVLVLVLICSNLALASSREEDEAGIHEVLARFAEIFAKRDAVLYASLFSDDADWQNAFGESERGRAAIERRLSGGHDGTHSAIGFANGLKALVPARPEGVDAATVGSEILFDSSRSGTSMIHVRESGREANDPLRGLDKYILAGMENWQIPGLAVAVVKDDRVVFLGAYGTRQVGREASVDVHTLFPIGSNTKAFTALAVAMLVDEGKLSWDEPIHKHLSWLEFGNPWITRNVTVRDLLSHRVAGGWGGSSYPFVLVVGGYGPAEILRRMRYLGGDGSGFRSRFDYDNANYFAAGELITAVAGVPWREFMHSRIFDPLGMSSAVTNVAWDERAVAACFECGLEGHTVTLEDTPIENIAVSHRLAHGVVVTAPAWRGDDNPAGAVHGSIQDVAKWLRFQLGEGSFEGKRLLTKEAFAQTHSAQVLVEQPRAELGPESGNLWAHGLGWFITDYRGRKAVMHGGGLMSYMALLPDERLGVAVLANLPSQFRQALIFHIFDRFLGSPERDWNAEMLESANLRRARFRAQQEKAAATLPPASNHNLSLASYTGLFRHRAYGNITVTEDNANLVVRFVRGQVGDLQHWEDNKFRVTWRGPYQFRGMVTFTTDADGRASSVHLEYPEGEFIRVEN